MTPPVGLRLSDGRALYRALPVQNLLHRCLAPNVLFGGAAGGSKSHGLRWHGILACLEVPTYPVLLLRRKLTELENTHIMALRTLPAEVATYNQQRKRLDFPHGSWMQFGYCDNDADFGQYLSTQWGMILVDEAGQFSPWQLTMLASRCRLPVTMESRTQMVVASNPGGPAHQYLKERFILKTGPRDGTEYDPADYAFIPAKVTDNPYIGPEYLDRLNKLPPLERAMYRDGSWDLPMGNLFAELDSRTHLVPAAPPDPMCRKVVSADWGWDSPAPALWWETDQGLDGPPRSRLYREWVPRETPPVVWAQGIVDRSLVADPRGELVAEIDAVILDSSAWDLGQDGSPSVAEQMLPIFREHHIKLVPAIKGPNSLKNSLALLRTYLWTAEGTVEPLLTISDDCQETWNALVTIQRGDASRGQDTDLPAPKQVQRHIYDAVRYFVMSRPKPADVPIEQRVAHDPVAQKLKDDPLSLYVAYEQRKHAVQRQKAGVAPVRVADLFPAKQSKRPWDKRRGR